VESKNNKNLLDKKLTKSGLVRLKDARASRTKFKNEVSLVEKLQTDTLQKIESGFPASTVFDALSDEIRDQGLSEGWTGEIFSGIDSKIRDRFCNASHFISELKYVGIYHFITNLKNKFNINTYEEIENDTLVEIIGRIRKEISLMDSEEIRGFDIDSERFQFAALIKVLRELEEEFNQRKEAKELKKQLEIEDEQTQRHKDLTLDRAVLFMDYLFRYTKTTSHNTEKAKAISFLTSYSENTVRPKLSTIYTQKDKKNSTHNKDLRIVRNLFNKLGLTEIVKIIDNDS
jgi:hypothetical protein